jgi:hypothetical protein
MADELRMLTVVDLQREFPDWMISMDRDFTGLCFAYRQSGSATLSGEGAAVLQGQIRDWLRRHDDLVPEP